jgi:hypothetical protein
MMVWEVLAAQGILTGSREYTSREMAIIAPESSETAGPRFEKVELIIVDQVFPSWNSEDSETAGLRITKTRRNEKRMELPSEVSDSVAMMSFYSLLMM